MPDAGRNALPDSGGSRSARRRGRGAVLATAALTVAVVAGTSVSADNGTDSAALRGAVDASAILVHLQALQDIADANGGNRAAGTSGYEASGAFVESTLGTAGYLVRRQNFRYDQFVETAPPTFASSPRCTTA